MPSSALLSLTGARWSGAAPDPDHAGTIARTSGLSTVAATLLAGRSPDVLPNPSTWATPSLDHLHDPLQMRNMEAALDRVAHAAERGEKVRIITDYDVDGTTSSLILQAAMRLRSPKADIDYHIPNRFDEGYGFSARAARQAAEDGVGLIVTADIGVRDHAAVEEARSRGVDVLICDHHLPAGADVPGDATVLCPPQQGDTYPNRALAACGVSLKLTQGLLATHPKRDAIVRSMLKLAAIGTVADLVSLTTPENRAIVSLGLQELNRGSHSPGLAALLEVSRSRGGTINAGTLGFQVGPRINAAGRVADARMVVELLNERDPERAAALAGEINRLNDQRRKIQKEVERQALERLAGQPAPFVVQAGPESEGWHRGVVGIVASRIKEEVYRPTAIVSIQGDTAVGSIRSVPGVHAVEALDSVSDLLVKYGGHPAAAGFTVPTKHLEAFEARLCAFVEDRTSEEMLVPERRYDAEVQSDDLTPQVYAELERLGPWGMGNPKPRWMVPAQRVQQARVIGQTREHAKFRVPRSSGPSLDAIWFGGAPHVTTLNGEAVDLLATLGENTWQGRTSLQLEVKDVRRARP